VHGRQQEELEVCALKGLNALRVGFSKMPLPGV